ncbi:hypothetical protein [uncultured Algoriphagus sp.]|uniref:hypothetical protein n=1 Tax=uncultured Algoriphagus sp. TaxID=417365 RepID=UPI0030EC7E21|tara:strand:+ start:9762 stop:10469 length:708 start_codon:yes stop_codon:yes gene_type:complete
MKQYNTRWFLPVLFAASLVTFSCSDDDPEPVPLEGIAKSSLIFTPITGGEDLSAHGDHFHGITTAIEGESSTIEFDVDGNAVSGGHLHLDPDGIYKVELQAWDYKGNRVEGDFLKDKATADLYKTFLLGGNLLLNTETVDESGAIFQPRDLTYGDGTEVNGKYETTGVLSYFTIGESNEGGTIVVSYVLREFSNPETKGTVERIDWNASDYSTRFPGEDVLKLNFEIHAEDEHDH